jgi:hypothetical protein
MKRLRILKPKREMRTKSEARKPKSPSRQRYGRLQFQVAAFGFRTSVFPP